MDYSDPGYAAWAVQNPVTTAEALAYIAQAHPDLRDRVVTHPNAYPQLVAWVAAQSTSAARSQAPPPPASSSQPFRPSAPQHPVAAGPQKKKKKTGLVVGLVAGVAVVAGVVAGLGFFVFDWFGSTPQAPTLTKPQAEALIGSEFMRDANGGRAPSFSDTHVDPSSLGHLDGCPSLREMLANADQWSSSAATVQRFEKNLSPQAFFDAAGPCAAWNNNSAADFAALSVHGQDGGWWITDANDRSLVLVYGNVWLAFPDRGRDPDDKIKSLFTEFRAAVTAAGDGPGPSPSPG
ncbi:MAG: hypothetical protein FWF02_02460 [Micrococcales bacterium]|nr:hypothetical protein [Micrococcales bacterium]